MNEEKTYLTDNDLNKLFIGRHDRPGDVFMETLKHDGLILAPGVYNAMGGYVASRQNQQRKDSNRKCTFNAVYLGHWSTSAMLLRKPDMGFIDLDFAAKIAQPVVRNAHPLPVIFDIETGFGDATTITTTANVCHALGIAVAHIEDQEDSGLTARRCGNHGGKWCTEIHNMVGKVESLLETLYTLNSSVLIMVRTDALTAANGGFKEAVERGKRYMSIEVRGSRPKILWCDALYNPDDINNWIHEFRQFDPNIILGFNHSPNRDWRPKTYYDKFRQNSPTYQDLYRNGQGFSVIWHTILQARSDMESTWNTFDDMAENGEEALWKLHERQSNHPVGDAQAMSGVREWQAYEQHRGGQAASERFELSKGYKKDEKNN